MTLTKKLDGIYKKSGLKNSFSFPVEIKTKNKRVFMMLQHTKMSSNLMDMIYPL